MIVLSRPCRSVNMHILATVVGRISALNYLNQVYRFLHPSLVALDHMKRVKYKDESMKHHTKTCTDYSRVPHTGSTSMFLALFSDTHILEVAPSINNNGSPTCSGGRQG
jgi:hypothetical protein